MGKLDVIFWDAEKTGPRFEHQEVNQLSQLESMFKNFTPWGFTPLGEALEHVYTTKLKGLPRQQNLWVQSGVGSAPNV